MYVQLLAVLYLGVGKHRLTLADCKVLAIVTVVINLKCREPEWPIQMKSVWNCLKCPEMY